MVDNLKEAEAFTCRANLIDQSPSRGLIFLVESFKDKDQLTDRRDPAFQLQSV